MFNIGNRADQKNVDTSLAAENETICQSCGAVIKKDSGVCTECGTKQEKLSQLQPQISKTHWLNTDLKSLPHWVYVVVLIIGLGLLFGNFHFVNGGNSGFHMIKRESFGFSEIFINVDAITSMPWISAKSRYPLSCRVLARERFIETDEEFEKRLQNEINNKFDKIMKETQLYIENESTNESYGD